MSNQQSEHKCDFSVFIRESEDCMAHPIRLYQCSHRNCEKKQWLKYTLWPENRHKKFRIEDGGAVEVGEPSRSLLNRVILLFTGKKS